MDDFLTDNQSFEAKHNVFARVILPLNLDKPYSYHVPEELKSKLQAGIRVEVQFGRSKLYAGIVTEIYEEADIPVRFKSIISILDDQPIVTAFQLKTWAWMAEYYCCGIGEVMAAALPAAFKLDSTSRVMIHPDFDQDFSALNEQEYLIAEALSLRTALTVDEIQKILNRKSIKKIIDNLIAKGIILIEEELKEGLQDKKEDYVVLNPRYQGDPDYLIQALDLIKRSELQTQVLLAFIQYARPKPEISRKELSKHVALTAAVLKALEKKGIFILEKRVIQRNQLQTLDVQLPALTPDQVLALKSIETSYENNKQVVLLHGVTGSGKTRVYSELIRKTVEAGGQVLYLLPEIALTTHLISRLKKSLGQNLILYHSRLSQRERIDTWKSAMQGAPVILAARSGIFLPFINLQLVIVDEEHDPSYKQNDPDPRYQARDMAIWLGSQSGAKVILGSATPSIETWYHAKQNKYGFASLDKRFGDIPLPEIELVDLYLENKSRESPVIISSTLNDAIIRSLRQEEQIILFQNRRGYAPQQHCSNCHWHAMCPNCDVSLTYHKYLNKLICHYCGYQRPLFEICPDCEKSTISLRGFGTEKLEIELKGMYPEARIRRLDFDTARTKSSYQELLDLFDQREIDILVGTQMLSKGLDFDHVGLVGILQADSMFYYPDYRSNERAYQLLTQVAGRAGRKNKQGRVVLQSYNLQHDVIKFVMHYDYIGMAEKEIDDRQMVFYPPFIRMIEITVKHKKPDRADEATLLLLRSLQSVFGERVNGPLLPSIPRIRNYHLRQIMIKIEKSSQVLHQIKTQIRTDIHQVIKQPGLSSTRFNIDVDPD